MRQLITCLFWLLASGSWLLSSAADWPQWLGPNRDGVSSESVAPWQGELKTLWRKQAGEGHSSPVVAGGRVFLHTKVAGKEQEQVTAYDAKSGDELWRSAYDRTTFANQFGNGPRATPLADGDRLYTLGVTGILACWQVADGKEIWKLDILKEFKAANLFFGISSSPVLDGDRLLAMVGGPEASLIALDKATGKLLWKSGGDRASYAAPIVTEHGGRRLGVFLTQQGVVALNPATGEQHWKFPFVDKLNESSTTPVRLGDMLFASSVTVGSAGLRLATKNGKPSFEEMWKNPQLTCYFATPVAVGQHLYVVTGSLPPFAAAKLHCVEAKSGKVLWTRPKVGKYHASLLRAKDRLLLLEEEGDLVLFEPNPSQFKELARTKICGETWAHPALSDGQLFVRDGKDLICVQLAAAKP